MFLTDFPKAFCLYSDLHKDVVGFRPRNHAKWELLGLEALNSEIDKLQEELEEILEADHADMVAENAENDLALKAEELEYQAKREERIIQEAKEAQEIQWVHWEVLEMNLIGLRHR